MARRAVHTGAQGRGGADGVLDHPVLDVSTPDFCADLMPHDASKDASPSAKAGQLFELDLDDAHRRLAWIGHLVRHMRLAKSNAAALEPRGLGGLPRLGEGEGAGGQDDADMRQVVRVHTSVHDAGWKRHISNT